MGINKLQDFLKSPHEAIIISSEENRRYFTGFPSTHGYLVVTKDEAVFFTDSRYIEAAQKTVKNCKAMLLKKVSEEIKASYSSPNTSLANFSLLAKDLEPKPVTGPPYFLSISSKVF